MLRDDDHIRAQPGDSSERSRLDPFVVATGDAAPRDQRDLMERPFFSLAKTPRTRPIHYKAADVEVQVAARVSMFSGWSAAHARLSNGSAAFPFPWRPSRRRRAVTFRWGFMLQANPKIPLV